jgi:hypothetical protein
MTADLSLNAAAERSNQSEAEMRSAEIRIDRQEERTDFRPSSGQRSHYALRAN